MPYSCGGGSSDGGFSPGDYDNSFDCDYGNSSDNSDFYYRTLPYNCYSYVDWQGDKKYVYAQENPRDTKPVSRLIRILWAPFTIIFLCLFLSHLFIPKRISSLNPQILLDDSIQVIASELPLRESMERFLEKTGVSPAVITVSQEAWQQTNKGFREFSKDQYCQLFNDEDHLLIVYSVPESSRGSQNTGTPLRDWKFECIAGNNVTASINPPLSGRFAKNIYDLLCTESDPGQVLSSAFDWLIQERSHIFKLNQEIILLFLSRSPIIFAPYLINLYRRFKRYKYRTASPDTPPVQDLQNPRKKIRKI